MTVRNVAQCDRCDRQAEPISKPPHYMSEPAHWGPPRGWLTVALHEGESEGGRKWDFCGLDCAREAMADLGAGREVHR